MNTGSIDNILDGMALVMPLLSSGCSLLFSGKRLDAG